MADTLPLWSIHLLGPDEIHAAPSFAEAEAACARVNAFFADKAVQAHAVVAPWHGTPERHAHLVLHEWPTLWEPGNLPAATIPPMQLLQGYVLAPVILTPLAVSQIKDVMETEFDLHIDQARPLWARLLEIAAGIPLAEQERMHVGEASRAPTPVVALLARLTDALDGWTVYQTGGYTLAAHHPDCGEVIGDSRMRGNATFSLIATLKKVLDVMPPKEVPNG